MTPEPTAVSLTPMANSAVRTTKSANTRNPSNSRRTIPTPRATCSFRILAGWAKMKPPWEMAKRALLSNPGSLELRVILQDAYARQERCWQDALDLSLEIQRLAPDSAHGYANVAAFLNRLDRFPEALDAARVSDPP